MGWGDRQTECKLTAEEQQARLCVCGDSMFWHGDKGHGRCEHCEDCPGFRLARIDTISSLRQERDSRVSVVLHDELPTVWVCEQCGQPIGEKTGRCNSAIHVGPGEDANGMAVASVDLAALRILAVDVARLALDLMETAEGIGFPREIADLRNRLRKAEL